MIAYVVVDACSGEDYSADDPTVLYVSTDLKKAIEFYKNEISNWEDGMTNYDSSDNVYENGTIIYECTDFEGDSHRIMKLVKTEIDE